MPLTELIIDGFKSFADKTTIHFGSGITGIVGPNGSGKSNITEAIRFAMGESRVKSLRGSNMKDVIFAGSQLRKPLNRAEVTLVFDNRKHDLHFKADEVAVTRRIFRDGTSSYLINKQEVRLRDVRELFLDSGISQNSLAIISQGRVDQILNSKPEERRSIFEEAAGVLHFKEQKELAESQLQKTQENLVRINDLVKELKSRLEPLAEQSSLAKQYKYEKGELDQVLKTLLAFQIQALNEQKEGLAGKAQQNQALLTKLDDEVKEARSAVSAKRQKYEEGQAQRTQLQKNLTAIADQLSDLNTNLQVSEQSKQFDQATKKEYESQALALEREIKAVRQELVACTQEEKALSEKQAVLDKKRLALKGELQENPHQLNQQLDQRRNAYIQLLQDQTSNNNQIVYLNTELKRTKEDSSYQNNSVHQDLQQAQRILTSLRQKGQALADERSAQQRKIVQLKQKVLQSRGQLSTAKEETVQKRNDLQRAKARQEALLNIQKRHEGYYYGVRNVLNNLSSFPGVIGVMGELLTFPSELEAAMTTALGGGVQDLVTDSRRSARDAINNLKENRAGRATFLPLDGLREYVIPASTINSLRSFSGFKGVASQLVSSQSKFDLSPAINYLLGGVIVVDTIDTALAISRRLHRYRIVTLDGDVISPGGSMTGGMRNQRNNSPLQINAEIHKLAAQIKDLEEQYNSKENKSTDLSAEIDELQEQETSLDAQLQKIEQEVNRAALSYQNQVREVKRLKDADRLYTSRLKERDQQVQTLMAKIKKAQSKQVKFDQQAIQDKAAIAKIEKRIKNFNLLNEKVQNQVRKIAPQLAVYDNRLENLRSKQKEKQGQVTGNQAQLNKVRAKIAALSKNDQLSVSKKEKMNKKRQALTTKRAAMQKKLSTLAGQLGRSSAQISQLDQVASRDYDLRKDAAVQQEEYSVRITKLSAAIDQKLSVLSEDYSLTYEAALAQAKEKNTADIRARLAKKAKLHRMSIADIGPVNLDAIAEYDKVKKRYDFLNKQQNDLLKARQDLQESMGQLDKEVKNRFSKTFKQIAVSFTKIFPVVFNGGHAQLVLTQPDDMLRTGIEIVAQPPGKKLQRLSLLSGGERALTAITLLFAMLRVNPVPFCILDEVEAALDDANVARFAAFLKKYDLHTQFIVITHRRGTMIKADQLFGVVMQESGVSQVLSVSLKDIKDEVN